MTDLAIVRRWRRMEAEREWVVVGNQGIARRSVGALVDLARRALARADGGALVLGADETRQRLGVVRTDLSIARRAIQDAERYRSEGNLSAARRRIAHAIELLAQAGGQMEAWQLIRRARLLLASIDLEPGDQEALQRARDDLLPLARVRPDDVPSEQEHPALLRQAFAEAAEKGKANPRGRLRVDTLSVFYNPAAIWIDGAPVASDKMAIDLPAGIYHVVVTNRQDEPSLQSLLHSVEVIANNLTVVEVDLELEGAIDPADGPAVFYPQEGPPFFTCNKILATRPGAGRFASIGRRTQEEREWVGLTIWSSPDGDLEFAAEAAVLDGDEASAVEKLIVSAVSGTLQPGVQDTLNQRLW